MRPLWIGSPKSHSPVRSGTTPISLSCVPSPTFLPCRGSDLKRRNVFVVLDETFVDWVPEVSLAREVRDDSYFFVVRSLTNFFALPGIRSETQECLRGFR